MKSKSMIAYGLLALIALGASATTKNVVKAAAADDLTLNIYSWEDYIYEPEAATDQPSVLNQFKTYYKQTYGKDITVNYETFSTNEDMYNKISLNSGVYDLIAPSEYMIQKMVREDLLEKYDYTPNADPTQLGTYTNLPNYDQYVSPYLKSVFKGITVDANNDGVSDGNMLEYAAGYMWGTVGIMYNYEALGGTQKVHDDFKSWDVLWNPEYKGKFSIKNSMRDTYFVALTYVYKAELMSLRAEYVNGERTRASYTAKVGEILNLNDDITIDLVAQALAKLKKNIYGLEVDGGKDDMITGKVLGNTAWSGDAVYSLSEAEESGVELYFSLPSEGNNIWFDGWVMPKGSNRPLAQAFVDFVSRPSIAALNMSYIGYTSAIAGDEILDLVHEMYDADLTPTSDNTVDLSYFFQGTVGSEKSMVITSDKVGRSLSAQYPSYEQIASCAVMQDFGTNEAKVIEMWTNFKATKMAPWTIVILVLVGVSLAAYAGFVIYKKKKSSRHARRKAR